MNNPIAKHMNNSNRAATMRNKKSDYTRKGKSKWKYYNEKEKR